MASVVVVIPSRGRPKRARQAIEAARQMATRVATSIVLAVDADDPHLPAYQRLEFPTLGPEVTTVVLDPDESGDLVKATNTVSMRIAAEDPTAIIGNFGDDHHARSIGWDRMVLDALQEPGIAYGNDLFQRHDLPTAPFISAAVVNALGWYALPTCRHLFIDNCWRDIGAQTGRLVYIPQMIIEHVHPLAGKGVWDEGYERANRQETIDHDGEAYRVWRETQMAADLARVRGVMAVAA